MYVKNTALVTVLMLTGAFTCTNDQKQPVVLTGSSAAPLIIEKMKQGCAVLMANPALVKFAVDAAIAAAKDTSGTINEVSNLASIGCSLLVPPPVADPVNKAG